MQKRVARKNRLSSVATPPSYKLSLEATSVQKQLVGSFIKWVSMAEHSSQKSEGCYSSKRGTNSILMPMILE